MKEAYSFTLERNVKVDEVTNTSENFGCLNRDCDALYRIRAINSSITKHFSFCYHFEQSLTHLHKVHQHDHSNNNCKGT